MNSWKRIPADVLRLCRLAPSEQILLLRLTILLGVCSVSLQGLGFQRTARWIEKVARPRHPGQLTDAQQAEERIRIGRRLLQITAHRGPVRALCLSRSLTFWWYLRSLGIDSTLRIGVRPSPGGNPLQAHAWVERGGQIINDSEEHCREFIPFSEAILPADR